MRNQTIFINSYGRCQVINMSANACLYNVDPADKKALLSLSGMTKSIVVNAVIQFLKLNALLDNSGVASGWTETQQHKVYPTVCNTGCCVPGRACILKQNDVNIYLNRNVQKVLNTNWMFD